MINLKSEIRMLLIVSLAWLPLATSHAAQPGIDTPFSLEFKVFVDGKERLESSMHMERAEDNSLLLKSSSKGTKGLARMIKVRGEETSRGRWTEAGFRPDEYDFFSSAAGKKKQWTAQYNYSAAQIHTQHEDGQSELAMDTPAWDTLSLGLELRRRLSVGQTDFKVRVVDEEDVDEHHYRVGETVFLDTAAGCFQAVELERVRENSTRYSRSWHAPELAWLPLKIQHGKTDGKDFELRLFNVRIDGDHYVKESGCR